MLPLHHARWFKGQGSNLHFRIQSPGVYQLTPLMAHRVGIEPTPAVLETAWPPWPTVLVRTSVLVTWTF